MRLETGGLLPDALYLAGDRLTFFADLQIWFISFFSSLDPDTDPLCALLMIDFYAIRSDEYGYLTQLYDVWDSSRNLRNLPNFAFSVPLALFYASDAESSGRDRANNMVGICESNAEKYRFLNETIMYQWMILFKT